MSKEPLSLSNPLHLKAEMARGALLRHQIQPYWSPDTDSIHDPMDEHDTQLTIKSFLSRLESAIDEVLPEHLKS